MFLVALLATLAVGAPILSNHRVRLDIPENPIPGQYIAVFKSSISEIQMKAFAKAFVGSKVMQIGTFKAFAAELTEEQVAALQTQTELFEYIAQDGIATAFAVQTNPPAWGIDRIDQRNLPLNNQFAYPDSAGTGSSVYVLDTGIRVTHTQFGGRAVWGANFAGGSNTDGNGHGTHCAGTVGGSTTGVAKASRLVAVKVLGDSGSGSWSGVISGIDWVVGQCASNPSRCSGSMSLGGGAYQAVDDAVNAAVNQGVAMVVAAGNNNANACNYSPARAALAITVGATDSGDNRASYSNYGTCTKIFAPGSSIYSAWHTSDTAYNTISGTSMACPHVAGVAALLQTLYPGTSPASLLSTLQTQSTKNVINNVGSGSPNYLLFTAEQM